MIRYITIENFKGIRDAVTIPIRPLTLLFGKNSAGKSTILQAMHYARELLQYRNPDPDMTTLGGDSIDLGGFDNLVHGHDKANQIRLEFEIKLDEFGLPPFPFASDFTEYVYGLDEEGDTLSAAETVTISLVTAKKDDSAHIMSYSVSINKAPLVKVEVVGSSACITEFNDKHMIFDYSNSERADTLCSLALEYWQNTADSNGWIPIEDQESCIPDFIGPLIISGSGPLSSKSSDSSDELESNHGTLFWIFMSRILVRSGQALLSRLERMRYVGPIREVPPRGYRPPLTPDESRWSNGLGAWDAMLRSEDITNETSHYLQDVLELGYSIRRENRIPLDDDGEIMSELRLLATQYEERDAMYLQERVLAPMDRLPRQIALQIHDETQHIDVDSSDIGVGVSQVIPVVVGALAPVSSGGPYSVFCVEQPELHVHPAVQVALGDLFIEAIRGSTRTIMIETHSEHLLLRLLRRLREDSDVPLTPDELSVVYVKPTPNGVELTPLPVTEEGEFTRQWPEGFFEERAEELF